jgi:hypothetical protein
MSPELEDTPSPEEKSLILLVGGDGGQQLIFVKKRI